MIAVTRTAAQATQRILWRADATSCKIYPSNPMAGLLILVVDDDRDTRDLYRLVFETSGYSVAEAASIADAIREAAAELPALVLTDWMLGDGDGFLLCERLRADARTVGIPIVAVTGHSLSPEEVDRAGTLGCVRVVTKPIDVDTLTALVARTLGAGVQ
jgi:two-component system cell cycle response regulator DivK